MSQPIPLVIHDDAVLLPANVIGFSRNELMLGVVGSFDRWIEVVVPVVVLL